MENIVDREQPHEAEPTTPKMEWLKKFKKIRNAPLGMIAIGIFLIVYTSFGVAYFQKQGDISDLESQIASQTTTLNRLAPARDAELIGAELAEAQKVLSAAVQESNSRLAALPALDEGIDVYDELLYLGHVEHLKGRGGAVITEIAEAGAVAHESGRMAIPYSLSVIGDTEESLLAFTQTLMTQADGLLGGLGLEDVSLQQTGIITTDGSDEFLMAAAERLLNLLKTSPASRQSRELEAETYSPFVLDMESVVDLNLLVQAWDDTAFGDEEMLLSMEEGQ